MLELKKRIEKLGFGGLSFAQLKAAAPALAIVAAGLIPVALLSLAISRARPGRAQTEVRP